MAPMATTVPDYQDVLDDLARAIRRHRQDCPPREAARLLLSYHDPGHASLVGIERSARRAVLYHERDRYAISVGIRAEGLEKTGRVLEDFTEGRGFDQWLRDRESFFDWIHPQFRARRETARQSNSCMPMTVRQSPTRE